MVQLLKGQKTMTYITISALRTNLADTFNVLKSSKKPMLVSKKGKVVAGLVDIDLLEDLMELNDKKYVESIKKARKEIEKGEVFTHEELFRGI